MSDKLTVPNDYLTVKMKDGDHELFMSSGLLREVLSLIDEPSTFLRMLVDQEFQSNIILLLFAPRDKRGNVTDQEFSIMEVQISATEHTKVISWVEDHVLHFFISNANKVRETMQSEKMKKLTDLLNGSVDYLDQNASAGATDVDTTTSR